MDEVGGDFYTTDEKTAARKLSTNTSISMKVDGSSSSERHHN